ncbi:hypothetical protein CGRA01v4_07137 [Colletotrichum graminicola]|uniref:Uncharacterized protein n=1 Tax=Colletotrichum graminicola (strain M1.001 / M2 / FGSC 10212) TaxID=645133 RepID=E3QCP0_COLGM|nr:uncharacterized protein GLRG_03772 [Colletotrichum graminicola M1.001]EFQ28628.1 hypothetical protein GLRG_03772 [Colletotrichum graminicola M1.001]WDK15856.1 hypothetical protein CGRA01v4_07137 [Colletotrichum graminicola]
MSEHYNDPIAKRILVSVSKKSPHWSLAWLEDERLVDEQLVNVAIVLLNSSNKAAQVAHTDTMLVAAERWPMRIWIVIDIFNTKYDPSKAHLPGQNDLPVIVISFSKKSSIQIATEGIKNMVNRRIQEVHDLHGDESRAPLRIDHANNNIPTFPSPRTRIPMMPDN